VLGHLLRAGGAVQADQRHVQRVDHGGGRRDVRPHQQRAGGLHGDLHEDGGVAAGFRAGDTRPVDGRLDLQRVLAGLYQEGIDVAVHQAAALFGQARLQRVVTDVAERGQLGARPHPAQHPAVAAIGKFVRRLARQVGGGAVDLARAVRQAELAQRDRGTAERVGLDHVGAGGEVAAGDVAHQIGARQVQHIGAILLAPVVALGIQVHRLHAAAGAAVAQQDLVAEGVEKMGSGQVVASGRWDAAVRPTDIRTNGGKPWL
jgi:hypothetical protein